MKKFSAQFKKQSERISMRASERAELRSRIVSYMEYHPLPKEFAQKKALSNTSKEVIVSEPFFAFTFNKTYLQSFSGVFAIILIMAVPALAERSVPGDVLYPVKVQFNEELRSSLSLTPYAKVVWETERLERRISEARLLASEGKLTTQAEAQVALAVKSHSDAAQREIAVLRQSNTDDAALAEISFASALEVQSKVLEGHIVKNQTITTMETGEDGRSVVALAGIVAQAHSSALASQAGGTPLSYTTLLATVEIESTNIYELFESVKGTATQSQVTDVERRLEDIKRKIEQARSFSSVAPEVIADEETAEITLVSPDTDLEVVAETDASTTPVSASTSETIVEEVVTTVEEEDEVILLTSEAEAVTLLISALTDIQKLLNYLTHIDVRENVSVEDLVPVTLTNAEKKFEIARLTAEIEKLELAMAETEISSSLAEKIAIGQESVDTSLEEGQKQFAKKNYDASLTHTKNAYQAITDLVILIAYQSEDTIDIEEVIDTEVEETTEEIIE